MNDFTKEELNDLLYCVSISCKQGVIVPSDNECNYLYEKLQSMIDNYCEHSHKQYYERVNIYECENCQMVML